MKQGFDKLSPNGFLFGVFNRTALEADTFS